MGRILEHRAKELIEAAGVAVPRGAAAASPEDARATAAALAVPVVVKALVPVGKRGKAGAVRFAVTPEETARVAAGLLGGAVGGYPIEQVLVEERLAIRRELYLSLSVDREAGAVRLLLGAEGGIEIEELSRAAPETLASWLIPPGARLPEFRARGLWRRAGIGGPLLPRLGRLTTLLVETFQRLDAVLLEINPLVETEAGELVAAGAVLAVDDAALFRHPELVGRVLVGSEKVWRPLTVREERVNELNAAEPYRGSARYLELEGGDIGFLCGGGGASLVLFDSLVQQGGQPANYAEFGGNPTETKVAGLARVVLDKPGVRGLFVAHNITNNTQVDVVARGVVRALREAGLDARDFPVVAREIGVNDAEGAAIFAAAGVRYLGAGSTLSDAARAMVRAMRERVASETGG